MNLLMITLSILILHFVVLPVFRMSWRLSFGLFKIAMKLAVAGIVVIYIIGAAYFS